MKATNNPAFLVNTNKDSAFILIQGKATFTNANTFKQFIDKSLEKNVRNYIIDFESCTGMDSTFLGIIAWLGLKIKDSSKDNYLIVRNFNKRNNELFHNLGLQNFIKTEDSLLDEGKTLKNVTDSLTVLEEAERCKAIDILDAHKSLVKASKENASLFKDLISLLENKLHSK